MQCRYLFADDWLGVRNLNQYFLGDMIRLEATVSQLNHVPLRVYVDRCVATVIDQPTEYVLIDQDG